MTVYAIKSAYDRVKRYVFSDFLNCSNVASMQILSGRLFHSFGAYTLNALSAKVFLRVKGTCNSLYLLFERTSLELEVCNLNKLLRYSGASKNKHLYTSVRTLKSIRLCTGNQCSLNLHSVGLSYFPFLHISFALMSWILCIINMWYHQTLYNCPTCTVCQEMPY